MEKHLFYFVFQKNKGNKFNLLNLQQVLTDFTLLMFDFSGYGRTVPPRSVQCRRQCNECMGTDRHVGIPLNITSFRLCTVGRVDLFTETKGAMHSLFRTVFWWWRRSVQPDELTNHEARSWWRKAFSFVLIANHALKSASRLVFYIKKLFRSCKQGFADADVLVERSLLPGVF